MRIIKALPYLVVSGDDAPIPAMNGEKDPASNSKLPPEVIPAGFCEVCHMTHSAATWKALSQRIER